MENEQSGNSSPSVFLQQAFDPNRFRQLGHELVDRLADDLNRSLSRDQGQVLPYRDPDQLWSEWSRLPNQGEPSTLFNQVLDHCIRLHHPHYFGHQISPVAPVAGLAGMLVDVVNNGMGVYEMGMAGTIMEREVIQHVARRMGFPTEAGGFITSGGSLANLTALLAARRKAVAESWQGGTDRSLTVLVSDQSHYCIDRAVRIMGLGEHGITLVSTNDRFQMKCECLESSMQECSRRGRQVIAVVGSACSTATGSFDDLQKIADFCQKHEIWFHVDGAHGAATVFSNKYRHLVDGIHRADSVTLDFHKLLLVPATASALIFRQESASYQTFSMDADYLFDKGVDGQWYNLARRTFECTKSMMSCKVFSVLHTHGEQIWEENVTRLYDLTRWFADEVARREELELLVTPESNIICFRYADNELSEEQQNRINRTVRDELCERGEFYIVQTRIDGVLWLRATVANAFSTEADITRLLDEIQSRCRSKTAGQKKN